jgi:PAS domain S-box-containing protein
MLVMEHRLPILAGLIGNFADGERGERHHITDELDADDDVGRIAKVFDKLANEIDRLLFAKNAVVALISGSTDAIITKTLQGVVVSWNPAAEEIFGYTEAEMLGQSISKLVPPDLASEEADILEKIGRGERIQNYQTYRLRKNGKRFPISVTISPINDRDGVIRGASKIARDITESVNAAEALKRAEERYELVLNGMSVGIWDWDIDNDEMYWSTRLRTIVGQSSHNNVEKYANFVERIHPDDQGTVNDGLKAHLDGCGKFDMAFRIRTETGEYAWVHTTGQAVWNNAGKPTRLAGSIEDISVRKKLESELVQLVDQLKATNRELDQFAYAAAHDLKAPLRVIGNAAQWLTEDLAPYLTDETRGYTAIMQNRAARMEKLLDDLLEYSRIGRGQGAQHQSDTKGGELLEDIMALLSPKAGFAVVPDASFAQTSLVRMPLQQVLMNLIGNAIKHHDKEVGIVRLGVTDLGATYEFTVEDDGPGIATKFHDQVFDMFRTLKPRDQVEGSGMGLAMVRKHVESLGGQITLQSQIGQGSLFRFTWPKPQDK